MLLAQTPAPTGVAPSTLILIAVITGSATIIGGLITVAVQSLIEWRKGKRSNRERWDKETYDLCLKLMGNCETIAPRKVYPESEAEKMRRAFLPLPELLEANRAILTRLEIAAPWQVSGRASNLLNASTASFLQDVEERKRGDKIDLALHSSYDDLIAILKSELKTPAGKKMRTLPHSEDEPSEFRVVPTGT
uniref:hypothetical protein n=1 Tax=Rhodococcus qingshengii TaxID=334542 RepID=UPI001C4E2D44|nr:hypothetical protein [Rhodococcus qingshengii]